MVPEFGNGTSVLNKEMQIDNNEILEIKFAIFLSNWIDGTESENNPLLEVLLENIYLSKYLVVCLGLL